MSVLTIVPARGGSKRLPNKNIKLFCGEPLIRWTLEAAHRAGCQKILVSTDSEEIGAVCHIGNILPRPSSLAQDDTPTIKVLQHALDWSDEFLKGGPWDWVLCLQPTSPLRGLDDIAVALATSNVKGDSSLVSVTSTSPLGAVGGATFKTNGAIYLVHRTILMRGSLYGDDPDLYYMPPERSIDIDTLEDFQRAEEIWKSGLATRRSGKVVGHT